MRKPIQILTLTALVAAIPFVLIAGNEEAAKKEGVCTSEKVTKASDKKTGVCCDKKVTTAALKEGAACSAEDAKAKLAGYTKVNLKVNSMSCGACEGKVTKALSQIEGVAEPTACSKSKKASFAFDPKKVKKEQVMAAIKKAGFKVDAELIEVKVDGLSCGACSSKVSKALTSVKGVKTQEVCHESKVAKIEFDPALVSEKEIFAAINKSGFKIVQ